jgi:hypothetical protein
MDPAPSEQDSQPESGMVTTISEELVEDVMLERS